jgi:hypothetical protein
LYIFKHWVLDVIKAKEKISSIREDLVPLIIKCQYQRKLVQVEEMDKCTYFRNRPGNTLYTLTEYSRCKE